MADPKQEMEKALLIFLQSSAIENSREYAETNGIEHNDLVGILKSLLSYEMVAAKETDSVRWALSAEAKGFVDANASAEAQTFLAIPGEGISLNDLKAVLGKTAEVGFKQGMVNKWFELVKGSNPLVMRKVDTIKDECLENLKAIAAGATLAPAEEKKLKQRKLISQEKCKYYAVEKGSKFALEKPKLYTDLNAEMMKDGSWKTAAFKNYNYSALGKPTEGGHLHPLLKVRKEFREIFFAMGFEEMPTNRYVENSFWNFDALFQPQQHPARDAHDTFFMTTPQTSDTFPPDYLERVRTTHETGGYGSIGYNYDWSLAEAKKNIMRTHTTAVSSRMLYKMAQEGFKPAKYFSIDRVFRNEAVDRTHLAEFHQIEGVICDRGLTLGHLIGILHEFFRRLGITQLKFKPAFNPYTEPSMEIFSYHPKLKKWVEVGNSGMFRPEMLEPMGLPPDVTVIAWGLSLERPTMILYDIDNIRDLFGHKVNLGLVRANPICRLQIPNEA
ncbi:hypothetical protein CYMTET_43524 [Cymbomonas tetramitiformis]|uniref:phenylalanine--tRNA ligase n=1 Tax=Cymbomonas tetramitiformis TaxID=36881 RepID=A0AAE0C212_9CHLO|nr:hypothetical protein CYMTET_43524 [Cymbomonas tetramitiformis]